MGESKKDDISMKNYIEVVAVMDAVAERIDGYEFYKYIFPDNEVSGSQEEDYSKPNAIFLYENDLPNVNKTYSRRIMLADTWEDDYMELVEQKQHTLCSGMTFRGKRTLQKNEQNINALIFDLDGVGVSQIKTLLLRFTLKPPVIRSLPVPTFLVASGGGVHLYYVFDEPIALFPNVRAQLSALKHDLTFKMWDWKSTSQFEKIQYQRIGQPFRMVGSINEKHGNEIIAYKLGGRVSIEYLNQYVMKPEHRVDVTKRYASRMTFEEAKEKYPEWAERVENGTYKRSKWDIAGKTHGKDPWALYHWWLRQADQVTGGHRYFYMMCCVVYGNKCDVPKDVVEKDLWKVYETLKKVEHENKLEEKDVIAALKIYKKDMYNYTIDEIKLLTQVPIEKNKRNHRGQEQHVKIMTAVRDTLYPNAEWRNTNGRPKGSKNKVNEKRERIIEYAADHPDDNVTEIAKALGVSRPTVYKYLNEKEEKAESSSADLDVKATVDVEKRAVDVQNIEVETTSDFDEERIKRMLKNIAELTKKMRENGDLP